MADNNFAVGRPSTEFKPLMANTASSVANSAVLGLNYPVGNIMDGGQLGLGPRPLNIDGVTPMVQNKATAVVLSTPTMWKYWPDLGRLWKALIETHATSISGISLEYTLETQESIAGQDTQQLSMPTTSARSAISPSVTWKEAFGNVVFRTHQKWINDIQHADTHVSQLGSILDADQLAAMPPWVYSTFSATMIIIQQDPLGLPDRLIDAVVVSNMLPKTSSAMDFNVETNSATVADRSITYTGFMTHNENTYELGRLVLEAIQISRPNFNRSLVPTGANGQLFDPNIAEHGLMKQVNEAMRDFKLMV